MKYIFGKQDLRTLERVREHSVLLTNGLGGYLSVNAGGGVSRCDQGVLVAAVQAPNVRMALVHRLRETLQLPEESVVLSTQEFADETPAEEGFRHLASLIYDGLPVWNYQFRGVEVRREMAVEFETNSAAVRYTIQNRTQAPCTYAVDPFVKFAPKEQALEESFPIAWKNGQICASDGHVFLHTNGTVLPSEPCWQTLYYPEDEKDGRPESGMTGACCSVTFTVAPGETGVLDLIFSEQECGVSVEEILCGARERLRKLENCGGFRDPLARKLALDADAFIARRDSTGGKTILAGYPLFSDWGRDTMIALPGCCLATERYADAASIIRTFLAYEQDGLVPNLFPEGEAEPMYNTVDAALLLIDCVWQYTCRTGETTLARDAWPVLQRIVRAYRRGTHHHIGMDTDGLIYAGEGLDQVTWMDVRVNDILPTPRHGKPVEINAYWYNALRIMDALAARLGLDGEDYGTLAEKVKKSFVSAFYMPEKGYLKDVISGTSADEQLRCNQIWAVSMSFPVLEPEQETQVVHTVERMLYTPCGLRTLSPEDPEYHGTYGGTQVSRDMAYHQGTVWVFPMGAYYRAWLKVHGRTWQAAAEVRQRLDALEPMLREGCAGQLPEIYSGDFPCESKGCFAQAWSVGELLRVFEDIRNIEDGRDHYAE